jgi:hypothetical protein
MRFPLFDQLDLYARFGGVVPGKLHPDGHRYLPIIVLTLASSGNGSVRETELQLGVVDRHHRVDQGQLGTAGSARLVCALNTLRLQEEPFQRGLAPEANWQPGRISTAPSVFARVLAVPSWEFADQHLPFQRLYVELLLDIGVGTIGMRTSLTSHSIATTLGTAQIVPGDHVVLERPRIDILAWEPTAT